MDGKERKVERFQDPESENPRGKGLEPGSSSRETRGAISYILIQFFIPINTLYNKSIYNDQ